MTPLALEWIWPDTPIALAVIVLVALLARWLIVRGITYATTTAIRRAQAQRWQTASRAQRILAAATGSDHERYEQRISTIGSLLRNLTSVVVGTVMLLTLLGALNVPLGPVLASAGVGGIALAFGAQTLIKDFLSGIFMIMEDQYGVGDLITIGDVQGTVEDVGLRVTRLRDGSGTVWYVRNGEVLRVGNQSQGWSTAVVDVPVAHDEDAARVIGILEQVTAEMEADPEYADVLLDKPAVAGVNAVTATTMTIRITGRTAPNQHWGVQRSLLERSLRALGRAGVRGPSPNLGVVPE